MAGATAAKKPTARKPTARKPVARKKPTARRTRVAKPMTSAIRELGASVLALASERAMASEKLGVANVATKELPGRRQGMVTNVRLDDGTRIAFTMVVR